MTAEVFDLSSAFCPPASKVEENSGTNIYDMWLGHSGVDVGSDPAPSLPLVATTITLEAIQNILWANGFAIEPPLTNDIGPGPFEDTQFDIVVDVETTDDMEGVFEFQTDEDDKKSIGRNSSIYESDGLSEEDLSVFPDIPLSPTPSVMSDSDFDFSSCDSGIEAEFDELHDGEGNNDQKNKDTNSNKSSYNNTDVKQENETTEGCHSCSQNRSNNSNGTKVETESINIKREKNESEESLDFHCQYLWEFLQHLLADSKYHSCIVWKNERRGIFRLTDHQRVADLWGKHKKRENMTYDKLSRALRYYYSRNILKKVDGQRLTYKFCRNLDGKKFAS